MKYELYIEQHEGYNYLLLYVDSVVNVIAEDGDVAIDTFFMGKVVQL